MKINDTIKKEADTFFDKISVNDFYSYTKSDFKNNSLINLSYEKAVEDSKECDLFIRRVNEIRDTFQLGYDQKSILDAIVEFCNYIKSNTEFYWHKFSITHNTSPLPYVIKALELYPDIDDGDIGNYIQLMYQLPICVRDMKYKLQKQKEMKIILPEEECKISIKMLEGLYQTETNKLKRSKHTSQINQYIYCFNEEIKSLIDYLKNDYLKGCIRFTNLSNRDGGQDYYDSLIKTYTSYNYKPEIIHEKGLENIEKTRNKMQYIIKSLGYRMSIEDFNKYIEKDPRFIDQTPEDLLNRMNVFLDKVRPKLRYYFKNQTITECEVRRIDQNRESSTSWGYYAIPVGVEKRGIYYFSAAELNKRCQIRTGSIVYHELLPGHHFQMNLAAEDESLPKICNQHFNTAYADGWAEYSADLAEEMGMYTEYDLYGRYLWDLILSTRLVVDTGINALGWTLEEIQRFMSKNTTMTDTEILTESLRYSVDMPGQALAYKMGSLKMHEFRQKAENILTSNFDIKEYHDVILKYGSIPLNIVENNVHQYIHIYTHKEKAV